MYLQNQQRKENIVDCGRTFCNKMSKNVYTYMNFFNDVMNKGKNIWDLSEKYNFCTGVYNVREKNKNVWERSQKYMFCVGTYTES